MTTLSDEFIGQSLSHGTLRPQDLIPTFLDFLYTHAPDLHHELLESWRDTLPHTMKYNIFEGDKFIEWIEQDTEQSHYLLEEITDALNEIAPEYHYFGSHPGDGSDFGYWFGGDNDQVM